MEAHGAEEGKYGAGNEQARNPKYQPAAGHGEASPGAASSSPPRSPERELGGEKRG